MNCMDVGHEPSLSISSKNIITVACLAIKRQLEISVQQNLDDSHPDVKNFLVILDHIFYHGLISNSSLNKLKKHHPWRLVQTLSHLPMLDYIAAIDLIDHLENDFARLRAWLKLSLLKGCLHSAFNVIIEQESRISKFYCPKAVFRSPEIKRVGNLLLSLESIHYSVDLKAKSMGYVGLEVIDYGPYLNYVQSLDAELDASCECTSDDVSSFCCSWREGFVSLRKLYVDLVEEKHYFEKVVKDQYKKIENFREALKQNKQISASLESLTMQLQIQLALIHEQYTRELQRLGGDISNFHSPTPYSSIQFKTVKNFRTPYSEHQSIIYPAIPTIPPIDQGIDALTLDSLVKDGDSSAIASGAGVRGLNSVKFRAVNFEVGQLAIEFAQSSCSELSDSIRRQSYTQHTSSTLSTFTSEFGHSVSRIKGANQTESKARTSSIGQARKLQLKVNVQEIPNERFILPNVDDSAGLSPATSFIGNLDSMMITVKPRNENLFTRYIPRSSDVQNIIQQVDRLFAPRVNPGDEVIEQTKNAHAPIETQSTTQPNDFFKSTSSPPSLLSLETKAITDCTGNALINKCHSLHIVGDDRNDWIESVDNALHDSLTNSNLMDVSELNNHSRVHSTKDYYHLTSEEDLATDSDQDCVYNDDVKTELATIPH